MGNIYKEVVKSLINGSISSTGGEEGRKRKKSNQPEKLIFPINLLSQIKETCLQSTGFACNWLYQLYHAKLQLQLLTFK
jgi:hypothetical protein